MIESKSIITNRRTDIDIAKAIGIILVVWDHAQGPLSNYIGQFHMPFFFFISGMLYKSVDSPVKDYFMRKFKSLILPFWWWNLLLYPLFFVLYYWNNWSVPVFAKETGNIILTLDKVPFLGATWFLPALFWISIMVHLIARAFRKFKYCDIYLVCCGLAICIIGFYITFPYRISRTLICSFFYICGYIYIKYFKLSVSDIWRNILAVLSLILYIFIASHNFVSLPANEYKYKIAFIVGALAAIFFMLRLSKLISELSSTNIILNHLLFIGRNTICIVIWHFLAFRIAIIAQIVFTHAPVKSMVAFPVYDASGLWWLVYIITGLYISLIWKYILEHNPLSKKMQKLHMI